MIKRKKKVNKLCQNRETVLDLLSLLGVSDIDRKIITLYVLETLQIERDMPSKNKQFLTWKELFDLGRRPTHGTKMITRNIEGIPVFWVEWTELIKKDEDIKKDEEGKQNENK